MNGIPFHLEQNMESSFGVNEQFSSFQFYQYILYMEFDRAGVHELIYFFTDSLVSITPT